MEEFECLKLQYIFLENLIKTHEASKNKAPLPKINGNQRTVGGQANCYTKFSNSNPYRKNSNAYKINQNAKFAHLNNQCSSFSSKKSNSCVLKRNYASSVVIPNQNPSLKSLTLSSQNKCKTPNSILKQPTISSVLNEKSITEVKSNDNNKSNTFAVVTVHEGKPVSGIHLPSEKLDLRTLLNSNKGLAANFTLQGSDKLQDQRSHIVGQLKKSEIALQELADQLQMKNHGKSRQMDNSKICSLPNVSSQDCQRANKCESEVCGTDNLASSLNLKSKVPENSVTDSRELIHQDIKMKHLSNKSHNSKKIPLNGSLMAQKVSNHIGLKSCCDETTPLRNKKNKFLPNRVIPCDSLMKKSSSSKMNVSLNSLKKTNRSPTNLTKGKNNSKFVFKRFNGKSSNSKYKYIAKPNLSVKKKDGSPYVNTANFVAKVENRGSSNASALNKSFTKHIEKKKCCKLLRGKYQLVNKSHSDSAEGGKVNGIYKASRLALRGKSKPKVNDSSEKLKYICNVPKSRLSGEFNKISFVKSSARKPSQSLIGKYKLLNITPVKLSYFKNNAFQSKWKSDRSFSSQYKFVDKRPHHVNDVVRMIKAKYKIVNRKPHSNSNLMKWSCDSKKTPQRKIHVLPNCIGQSTKNWHIRYSYQNTPKHTKKCLRGKKSPKKYAPDQNKKLVKIGGTAYKVSKTQVIKASKSIRTTPKSVRKYQACNNASYVAVRGSKFKLISKRKSLTRLTNRGNKGNLMSFRRLNISGVSYIQTRPGCLKKSPSAQTRNLASRVLNRSIHRVWAASAKKNTKSNNNYCMFYNRFGRCNKGNECKFIHDPSKVAICSRFLRGTCKIEGCPFSHVASLDKMPICSFFLRGICSNNECPYKHTTIEPETKLCKAFVRGYCHNGNQCKNAHILACPQFFCEGYCEKESSCAWPHPPLKEKRKNVDSTEVPNKRRIGEDKISKDFEDLGECSDSRYFACQGSLSSKQNICDNNVDIEPEVKSIQSEETTVAKITHTRALTKFCVQPEFIPLSFSDDEEY